jgi:hypothetical protein
MIVEGSADRSKRMVSSNLCSDEISSSQPWITNCKLLGELSTCRRWLRLVLNYSWIAWRNRRVTHIGLRFIRECKTVPPTIRMSPSEQYALVLARIDVTLITSSFGREIVHPIIFVWIVMTSIGTFIFSCSTVNMRNKCHLDCLSFELCTLNSEGELKWSRTGQLSNPISRSIRDECKCVFLLSLLLNILKRLGANEIAPFRVIRLGRWNRAEFGIFQLCVVEVVSRALERQWPETFVVSWNQEMCSNALTSYGVLQKSWQNRTAEVIFDNQRSMYCKISNQQVVVSACPKVVGLELSTAIRDC